MSYRDDAQDMADALRRTPNWSRVLERHNGLDEETVLSVLDEAAAIAHDQIAPLNRIADQVGAQFVDGRVRVPDAYHNVFNTLAEGGWLGLEQSEALGGQGLPLSLFCAINPFFERACPAFMMVAGSSRAAALLLTEWADEETTSAWVPALANGECCATICISESEAGSDVGRLQTRATQLSDGSWQVSGQKIWISFGDHDLRSVIGHCMLARTSDQPGTRGLSLFLVPNSEGVVTERIEEKLGLHGSPTCALRFDNAPATLVGEENRGLSQLFTMIRHMRLTVSCQGLGGALECFRVATEHAANRRQGGNPKVAAVAINQHPDVRRQLLQMQSAIDLYRLALLETATAADLSDSNPELQKLCGWLLPLIKNFGAELAFNCASQAIQVLGGVGYTKDYSVEQVLRDSRVYAIYEGTTGMQAQDFLLRQSLPEDGATLAIFIQRATLECENYPVQLGIILAFSELSSLVLDIAKNGNREYIAAMADGFMRAGWVAVQAWLSVRMSYSLSTQYFLATANEEFALHHASVLIEPEVLIDQTH